MAPEKKSDARLLEAFLDGQEAAFTELMRRHEGRIFALALRITGDRNDAMDATQETFITAFRKARSFRGDAAFGTWLYRIGMNACHDLIRRRKPETLEEEPEAPPSHGPRLDDSVAMRIDVGRALAELPVDYRIAIAMHDLGGISYEEIAKATDAPLGTVKSRISRGRQMLARALEQDTVPQASKERR